MAAATVALRAMRRPGDIVADRRVLEAPLGLDADAAHFRAGLYNWASDERLPVSVDGIPSGDFVLMERRHPAGYWSRRASPIRFTKSPQ